jgi:(p)ppGpp synthase/HD superfamily hydrolase
MAIFGPRIERAIALALAAHADQVRKGDGLLPYAVHPVTVALILSRYTGEEDVIVAGLLHDVLEDTAVSEADLARDFGDRVGAMVRDLTEPKLPGLSWDTRKARYLRRLEAAPRGSLLIACADEVANLVSMLAAHAAHGDALRARFNAPLAQKLGFYRQVCAVVQASWPTCPLLQEFRNRLEEAERKLLSPDERARLPALPPPPRVAAPPAAPRRPAPPAGRRRPA